MDYIETDDLEEFEEAEELQETEEIPEPDAFDTCFENLTESDHREIEEEEWDEGYADLAEEDPAKQALLEKPISDMNWHEFELKDGLRNPDYEAQVSFLTDDTGQVLQDEYGDFIRCAPNTPGAQRPDYFRIDEDGQVDIREIKNPVTSTGIYALGRDIEEQTEKRRTGFGDPHLTYVVNPSSLTVGNAEYLTRKCEDLDVDIDYPFH